MDCAVCQKPAKNKCAACKNVSYCSGECQKKDWKIHKISCSFIKAYCTKKNDDGTEYFEAARDLPVGTIIFDETPIFQIPWIDEDEIVKYCLSCSLPIPKEAQYQSCSKCTWPICSPECEKLSIHRDNECEFLSSNKMKCAHLHPDILISIGSRGLMIKRNNKELWDYFQSLGMGNEEFRRCKDFSEFENLAISAYKRRTNVQKKELKEVIKMGEKLKNFVISSGFIRLLFEHTTIDNSYTASVFGPNYPRDRGIYLYKTVLKMTHSCSPNTNWHIGDYPDFKIRIRSIVPIKKGEKLTLSRLNAEAIELRGTIPRSEFLRRNRSFFCRCPRCLSPSEFETYLSAIRCDSCFSVLQDQYQNKTQKETTEDCAKIEDVNSGYLLPVDPMAHEKDGHCYLWKCNRCQKTTPYSKFLNKMKDIEKEMLKICPEEKFTLDLANQFIEKYEESFLHPNHYLFQHINKLIIHYYYELDTPEDVPESDRVEYLASSDYAQFLAQMEDGIRRCDFLLNIVDKILPGFSYAKMKLLPPRAHLNYFLHTPPPSSSACEMEKHVYAQGIQNRKEELQQILDFFKYNLPSHRGQEKCDEYIFFKSQLDSLEQFENEFSSS